MHCSKEMCSITHTVTVINSIGKQPYVVHCEDFGNGHSIQNNLHTLHTEKL